MHTADIPIAHNVKIATFANGIALLSPYEDYPIAVSNLHKTTGLRIGISNVFENARIDFSLRPPEYIPPWGSSCAN